MTFNDRPVPSADVSASARRIRKEGRTRLRAVDRKSVARSLYFLQKTLAEMIEAGVRPPDVDGRQHEPGAR